MMNYIENGMPRLLGCPDGLAAFYENLNFADDERLHAIGVSTACSRQHCTRRSCPFRPQRTESEMSLARVVVEK